MNAADPQHAPDNLLRCDLRIAAGEHSSSHHEMATDPQQFQAVLEDFGQPGKVEPNIGTTTCSPCEHL